MPIDFADYSPGQCIRAAFDETTGRLKVDAEVTATLAALEVEIDAEEDSIKIGDGEGNFAEVTPEGEILTKTEHDSLNYYSEISGVAQNIETTILEQIIPQDSYLDLIEGSGEVPGLYILYLNNNIISKKRTNATNFNLQFEFGSGLKLNNSDTLKVTIQHFVPSTFAFNSRIQLKY